MNKLFKKIEVIRVATTTAFKVQQNIPSKVIGTWLANECQRLGPTYIKIGQFISSRKDIFTPEFASCFDVLRDQVSPFPVEDVERIIKNNPQLTKTLDIETKPIASASIGQVHKAKSKRTGAKLIVKFKRPNIKETIKTDIEFLRYVINLMISFKLNNAKSSLNMLNEFETYLLQEIDFKLEAFNLTLFYELYYREYKDIVKIPLLIKSLSNNDVLVMEYVHDVGISQYKGDRQKLARDLMDFFIKQLIEYGTIHGDPHKGNIGITEDGKIILYDYGSVINFDQKERFILKELVYMLIVGNKYGIIDLLTRLGVDVKDQEAMLVYVDRYIEYMRTIDIKVFQGMFNNNTLELPLQLNGKIFRLLRVYGILEGICKELDPSFNYFDLLDRYTTTLLLDEDFIIYKANADMSSMQNVLMESIFKMFVDQNKK